MHVNEIHSLNSEMKTNLDAWMVKMLVKQSCLCKFFRFFKISKYKSRKKNQYLMRLRQKQLRQVLQVAFYADKQVILIERKK